MQLDVEAIRHKDVRGKELTYVKLKLGTKEVLINVGNKTYTSVYTLTTVSEGTTEKTVVKTK